jgi:hypothetical protein
LTYKPVNNNINVLLRDAQNWHTSTL